MTVEILLGLHVVLGAVWFGMAVSFRARPEPHKAFLAIQVAAAVLAILFGAVVASVERPGMDTAFGRLLMVGAALAVLAIGLMVVFVVWPTVSASRRMANLTSGAAQRMIFAERGVAGLLLAVLTLMTLAHRI